MTDQRLIELAAIFHTEYATWNFRGCEVIRMVDGSYGMEDEVVAVFSSIDEAADKYTDMADIAAMKAVLNALTPEEMANGVDKFA